MGGKEQCLNASLCLRCRPDPTVEIAFIRRRSSSSSSSGSHSPVCLQGCGVGAGPQTKALGLGSTAPQQTMVTKITSSRNPACETLPPVNVTQVWASWDGWATASVLSNLLCLIRCFCLIRERTVRLLTCFFLGASLSRQNGADGNLLSAAERQQQPHKPWWVSV